MLVNGWKGEKEIWKCEDSGVARRWKGRNSVVWGIQGKLRYTVKVLHCTTGHSLSGITQLGQRFPGLEVARREGDEDGEADKISLAGGWKERRKQKRVGAMRAFQ